MYKAPMLEIKSDFFKPVPSAPPSSPATPTLDAKKQGAAQIPRKELQDAVSTLPTLAELEEQAKKNAFTVYRK